MKKTFLKQFAAIMLLIILSVNLMAVPANPNPVTIKQPNGKTLTFTIKGYEKVNWATTIDQYTIIANEEGTFVYAKLDEKGNLVASKYIAANPNERTEEEKRFLRDIPLDLRFSNLQLEEKKSLFDSNNELKTSTTGTVKLLLILCSFSDKPFTYTNSDFDNLCNQTDYSINGATGSVKDYYYDNSGGLMNLEIDVVGPITLPNTSSYYANNWDSFVSSALSLADPTVDFSLYRNGDTKVSNIHLVFAGQPRSSTGNPDEIWPHQGRVSQNTYRDGVRFSTYSCSAEKRTATDMDGVGTMCHEMGHAFGLMDLYDTDNTQNGEAVTPGRWSLMDQGSYNNNSNTPPYLNGWERQILGWGNPIILAAPTSATLPCLADSLKSYKIDLNTNEYFLIEHRMQKGWDTYIPGNGMIIFHADKNRLENTTPFYYNDINVSPTDRGFFIEVATGNNAQCNSPYATFGSVSGQYYFTSQSTPQAQLKNGTPVNKPITHIAYLNDSVMTFNYLSDIPMVKTLPVSLSTIMGTQATVNGSIIYMGTQTITEKGMYWHTSPDSANVLYGTKVVSTSNDTLITTNLTLLPTSTTIYFRAFATTAQGTTLANEVLHFTTSDGLGIIITSNPTNVANSSATMNGNIISSGDAPIISKGFVYTTNPTSSITLDDNVLLHTGNSIGTYSVNATSLSEQTTYYYRAFVTTSLGTKYGSKKNFTTSFPEILNNTISSSQSYCTQATPQQLTGLNPTGGYGNFTYLWQQKTRNGEWTNATQTNSQLNYQPELLSDSTFYRRIVSSNNIKDTSNIILINIKNSWGGILTSLNDTIAKGETTGTIKLASYIGTILNWERKKDNQDWNIINHTTSQLSEIIDTSGNYTYRVKVQLDNCPETYSSERIIYVKGDNSLTDIDLNIDMKIYPNPTKGQINITSSYTQPVQLRIINSLGQIKKSETAFIENKTLDLSSFENGVYLINIYAQGRQTTKTILINK